MVGTRKMPRQGRLSLEEMGPGEEGRRRFLVKVVSSGSRSFMWDGGEGGK